MSPRIDTALLSHVSVCGRMYVCVYMCMRVALYLHKCIILLDNVSRVQLKATPLPGSDYINAASFVDVSILTIL